MAVYKADILDVELNTGNIARSFLCHNIGKDDTKADRFGVRVYRDGEPESLSGCSIQGYMMRPNGTNLAITGSNTGVSGNEAWVDLPQAAYDYEGQFCLALKLIGGGVTGTIRIIDGMINNTFVDDALVPMQSVPTYQEILAVYDQMVAAKNGSVRFDQSQSLTETQKSVARMNIDAASESDVSDLKSALTNDFKNIVGVQNLAHSIVWENGVINDDGSVGTGTDSVHSQQIPVQNGSCSIIYSKNTVNGVFRVHGYKNGAWVKLIYKSTAVAEDYKYNFMVDDSIDSIVLSIYRHNTTISLILNETVIPERFDEIEGEVEDIKNLFVREVVYVNSSADALSWVKGSAINSVGRYAINHPESVSVSSNANTPYVLEGTHITVKSGYVVSMAIWSEPVTSSIDVSKNLYLIRNVSAGTVIAPVTGYLALSIANEDGTAISDGVDAVTFASNAISSMAVYSKTLKKEIERVDADIAENTSKIEELSSKIIKYVTPDDVTYTVGNLGGTGQPLSYKNAVLTSPIQVSAGDYIECDSGFKIKVYYFSSYSADSESYDKTVTWTSDKVEIDKDEYVRILISDSYSYNKTSSVVLPDTSYSQNLHINIKTDAFSTIQSIKEQNERERVIGNYTDLYLCQKATASYWHFPFIDTYNALGLGDKCQIPGTKTIWSQSGNADLTQRFIWMEDGTHPHEGIGVKKMYGLTIAQQLALVSPSYRNSVVSETAPYWTGKKFLWMGTSIPAGSDPGDTGNPNDEGPAYPFIVANLLGATVNNIARGSSCVRANASDGKYTGFLFNHFIRSFTRTVAECSTIASNWDTIKANILNAPETLSSDNIETMESHSFENLLLPYLNGTNAMPDLFVIDYGHNDVRPKGIDGKRDLWIVPTANAIHNGILAEDTYMTANNYANLKLAMNNDLSGIDDLEAFAATVNRNCLQGALNFIVMVIFSRNPYARIVLVSDYN